MSGSPRLAKPPRPRPFLDFAEQKTATPVAARRWCVHHSGGLACRKLAVAALTALIIVIFHQSRNIPCENQIDENYNKLLFGELSSGWYYYINCVSAPGSHKLPHTGRQMGVGISGLHLNDLLTGKKKTMWLKLPNFILPNFTYIYHKSFSTNSESTNLKISCTVQWRKGVEKTWDWALGAPQFYWRLTN